jgi:hypothetical protein
LEPSVHVILIAQEYPFQGLPQLHLARSRFAGEVALLTRPTRDRFDRPSRRKPAMSKETPKDDPRQRTDWKSPKQTDEPWKGPPEKEQKPGGASELDLEKWHQTNTH